MTDHFIPSLRKYAMLLHFLVDGNRGHSRFRNGPRYLHPDIGGYSMFLKSSAQRLKLVINFTQLSKCRYPRNLAQTTALPCSNSLTAVFSFSPSMAQAAASKASEFGTTGRNSCCDSILGFENRRWLRARMTGSRLTWPNHARVNELGIPILMQIKLFLGTGRIMERIYCFPEKV